jgi:hypothetical protein
MNTKFTTIIIVATIVVLASGLIVIPAQNASAIRAVRRGLDVGVGSVRVHAGDDGLAVSIGSVVRQPPTAEK